MDVYGTEEKVRIEVCLFLGPKVVREGVYLPLL